MRLLNARTRKLEEFVGDAPEYVILSHTWGKEEVSFNNMNANLQVEAMEGYRKINFACEQALADQLHYVWIDTCCIDKSSSAELSEAINSMWWYYRNAKICYAFLDDIVSAQARPSLRENNNRSTVYDEDHDEQPFGSKSMLESLANCRWFSRGWTLQELIAPPQLLFYDANWVMIGSRNGELLDELESITQIPSDVLLSGNDLQRRLRRCSIAQRMSWAAGRNTCRVEDEAYCLLGLFEVNMPMLYGEGNRAFRRLQEEIIKTSTDHSIFARNIETGGMLFARTASEFRNCANIEACRPDEPMESYSMTNRGLMITLPIDYDFKNAGVNYVRVVLNCTEKGKALTITLQQLTRTALPSRSPLEYTVLAGPPDRRGIDREMFVEEKRTIVIVPRSLLATATTSHDFNAPVDVDASSFSFSWPTYEYNDLRPRARRAGRPSDHNEFDKPPDSTSPNEKPIYVYNVWEDRLEKKPVPSLYSEPDEGVSSTTPGIYNYNVCPLSDVRRKRRRLRRMAATELPDSLYYYGDSEEEYCQRSPREAAMVPGSASSSTPAVPLDLVSQRPASTSETLD